MEIYICALPADQKFNADWPVKPTKDGGRMCPNSWMMPH